MLDWRDATGARHRVSFDTRREAEEAKRQVSLGIPSTAESEKREPKSLKDALRFYFENESSKKASKDNEEAYLSRMYKSLRAQGVFFIHEVKPEHMIAFRTERSQDRKASTVNREFNTYRHVFSQALAWKWIDQNPCESVENLPIKKNPRRVWTPEEFETIIELVPQWTRDVLRVMRWTGAGPTEISRIKWSDVDFRSGHMLIKRYKGTGEEFRRFMPMTNGFLEFMNLRLLNAKQERLAKQSDPAFPGGSGRPFNPRFLAQAVRRAARLNGFDEGLVPYGIRHTVATELLEAGVGEDIVRRHLGHKDVRTLIENYSHVRPSAMVEAMKVRAKQVLDQSLVTDKSVPTGARQNRKKSKKSQLDSLSRKARAR